MSELFEQAKLAMAAHAAPHLAEIAKRRGERVKELEEALREAVKWLRETEDGTNEEIRAIFGQETLEMVLRWERLLAEGGEVR